MAILRRYDSGRHQPVVDRMVVGRSSVCGLRLDSADVSGEHAAIRWEAGAWTLRDLGSRNGTWIGDRRVQFGELVTLEAGAQLRFGGVERWELIDDGPPAAMASRAGEVLVAEDGLLALPSAATPLATVFRAGDGRWMLEQSNGAQPIESGERLELDGQGWVLHLPFALPPTKDLDRGVLLSQGHLRLEVSRDEEHVAATLEHPRGRLDLGARSHHLVLLQLARLREADATLSSDVRGWVYHDELAAQLGLDPVYLNVLIYRARRHLAGKGVVDAVDIVERRPGTRQLRLGLAAFTVAHAQ